MPRKKGRKGEKMNLIHYAVVCVATGERVYRGTSRDAAEKIWEPGMVIRAGDTDAEALLIAYDAMHEAIARHRIPTPAE